MCFLPVCGLPLASYGNQIVPASFLITLPWTFPLKKQPFPPQQNPNPNSIYVQVIFWPLLCPVGLCFHLRGHVKLSWLLRLLKSCNQLVCVFQARPSRLLWTLFSPIEFTISSPAPACLPVGGWLLSVWVSLLPTPAGW